MLAAWRGGSTPPDRALYFEHEGNCAIRVGEHKLVKKHGYPWELFDLSVDRSEMVDLAAEHPDLVEELAGRYEAWARTHGVKPRGPILEASGGPPRRNPNFMSSYSAPAAEGVLTAKRS